MVFIGDLIINKDNFVFARIFNRSTDIYTIQIKLTNDSILYVGHYKNYDMAKSALNKIRIQA